MSVVRTVLKAAAAAVGLVLYVWYAAVRSVPRVKVRKRARRERP